MANMTFWEWVGTAVLLGLSGGTAVMLLRWLREYLDRRARTTGYHAPQLLEQADQICATARAMRELDDAAEDAKYQLAWCVPVVLYLHSIKECADETATLIKEHPEQYVSKSHAETPGPPIWAKEALERAIGIIEHAEGASRYEAEHSPGGYLNKASVVYAMSLVDWFVDKAHAVCCPGCSESRFRERLKCLNKNFGEPWFFDAIETKRVRYLALIRNMVVHQRAKTDRDLKSKSFQELRRLSHVWPAMPLKEFDQVYAEPERTVVLDIAKVILPGIRYCFDFLDYVPNRANDFLGC